LHAFHQTLSPNDTNGVSPIALHTFQQTLSPTYDNEVNDEDSGSDGSVSPNNLNNNNEESPSQEILNCISMVDHEKEEDDLSTASLEEFQEDETVSRHPISEDDTCMTSSTLGLLQESWVVESLELGRPSTDRVHNNHYINKVAVSGGINMNHPNKIKAIFDGSKVELSLFFLFLTKSYFETVLKWTNMKLAGSVTSRSVTVKRISSAEFFAYIGLELGMGIICYNNIDQYWSTDVLEGHPTYKITMSRDKFELIRSMICFTNPSEYNHEVASKDPLWHSRSILEHLVKNSATVATVATVATPTGPSSLDECAAPTKARTTAKTFNKEKPDKFAVRFYAVVGSVIPYMSSLCDNHAGNKTGVSGALDYCRVFRTLRTPLNHLFHPDNRIKFEKDSPSSLWVLQMAHQTKMCPDPSGGRVFFTDNFYTHHPLATALKLMTDGEARMIGTVRSTLVDATNRYY